MNNIKWYANITRMGDDLLIRGFDENNNEVDTRIPYSPTLYVEHFGDKDYGVKNIKNQNLKPIHFHTMGEATEFSKQHRDSNLTIYGSPFFAGQYCLETFRDTIDVWNKKAIRVFNIDIEVVSTEGFPTAELAAYPVTAICIHDSKTDRFVTFGTGGVWSQQASVLPPELLEKVVYVDCASEQDLLRKFLDFWQKYPPHIVTGWNVEGFDMPYLFNRLNNIGINAKKLSPWGVARLRTFKNMMGESQAVDITGVDVIDYLDRYKKNKIQDSYRLDNIASIELGENKLDYSEVAGLHQLYFTNFQKFIDYNIQDVNLVKRLDEKMGLIDAQIMIAYTACVNITDVAGTVRTWDSLISAELWKENKVAHFHQHPPEQAEGIPGGHVKDPQVGKHGWCMSFDLNSLYPHLIMQFNISPENLNKDFRLWPHLSQEQRMAKLLAGEPLGDVPPNHSISAAGFAYNNEFDGIIPRIMKRFYQERKAVKKIMLDKQRKGEDSSLENLRQYVIKILLNSGYGAFINKYYRWYDRRMGESITLSGQFVIQVAEREINKWMNKIMKTDNVDYIIAIDTDSNYVNVQPLVDKFFSNKSKNEIVDILDQIAQEQIQKVLEKGFEGVKDYLTAKEQAMVMEREAIASSAFWTAKKRYAMCVWDMEGVRMADDKPKIKIQGLEAIRSSTPPACRKPLLEIIKKTLLTDEITVQTYIADFKKQFMSLPYQDIAFPRSINGISKFDAGGNGFASGTPPQVRGAIVFNRMLKKHGLENTWESMKDGEKGKFMYLRQPNNIGTDVISFSTTLPPELDCEKYIDKEQMFQKAVVDPIQSILDPIGWSTEKRNTLMDFFG
jgi:DNA polymerase elongation subunit (family B)